MKLELPLCRKAGFRILEELDFRNPTILAKDVEAYLEKTMKKHPRPYHGLTAKQWAIARMLFEGLLCKQIADRLFVGVRALRYQREQIEKAWGVRGRMGIARRYSELTAGKKK